MLASCCDHKYFGGVGAELCHRQQPADVKVSGRTGRAMGCGGCVFTCVSCMLHRLQLVIKNIFILSFNLRPTSTRPSSGSQYHQHHRIRCARHVLVTSSYRPEADEQLLLLRRTRMRVLLALRARIECDCSCSVLARERSQLSGELNRIAGPRGLRPNVSIQCLSRPISRPYFTLTTRIGFALKLLTFGP